MLSAACGEPDTSQTPGAVSESNVAFDAKSIRYSAEHLWVQAGADGKAYIGISPHLWKLMTDDGKVTVSEFTLSPPASEIARGDVIGYLETSKFNLDIISPLTGTVLESNTDAMSEIHRDYGTAWCLIVKMSRPEELGFLMTYEEYISSQQPAQTQ